MVGDIFTSPSAPSVPNWLTINAATPAACGDAIDVPEMQPYVFPGKVEGTPTVQSTFAVPPGAATSVAPVP